MRSAKARTDVAGRARVVSGRVASGDSPTSSRGPLYAVVETPSGRRGAASLEASSRSPWEFPKPRCGAACRRVLVCLGNRMKKNAAIYLRVSTDEQTVDNQRPDLERFAEARGLVIVATY